MYIYIYIVCVYIYIYIYLHACWILGMFAKELYRMHPQALFYSKVLDVQCRHDR